MCHSHRVSLAPGPGERIKLLWGIFLGSLGHLVLIDTDSDYLISELSRVSYDINSVWVPSQTIKKYQSLSAQLHLLTDGQDLDLQERFEVLKRFFFNSKQFSTLAAKPKMDRFLLPYILLSRSGPPEILLLLFICLARALNIRLQVIKSSHRTILKFVDNGRPVLSDFDNHGRLLSTNEVIELINDGCDFTKTVDQKELLTRYLLLMKTQCLRERSFLHLYKIQSYLIQLQPFVLNHLVDRARAAYAIGDLVKAAEDIGQYLSFHTDKISNYRFLKLLRKLREEKVFKHFPYFNDHP
jgi:regulator of sirC expression with transglutaminase-like and TPR domain